MLIHTTLSETPPLNKSKYVFNADIIRVIAIIMVVGIHTVNSIQARPDFLGGTSWWIATIINSISRIAIPLFIMLSGFLILRKSEPLKTTYKRIVFQLLIPLIFWIAIYLIWADGAINYQNIIDVPKRLWGGGVVHLYFLVILMGLYLVSPLLRLFIQNKSRKSVSYYGLTFLILGILFTSFSYLYQSCTGQNSLNMWVPFVGYYIFGFLITTKSPTRKVKVVSVVAYFFTLIITIAFGYIDLFLTNKGLPVLRGVGCMSHYFDNYVSVNVVIMSLTAFLILFHNQYKYLQKSMFIEKSIYSIARTAFGIFVIHILVIQILEQQLGWYIDNTQIGLLPNILIKWVVVFYLSYVITLIGMRIPYIKYLFGAKPIRNKRFEI